jgi:hypothetical protein
MRESCSLRWAARKGSAATGTVAPWVFVAAPRDGGVVARSWEMSARRRPPPRGCGVIQASLRRGRPGRPSRQGLTVADLLLVGLSAIVSEPVRSL